MKKCLFYLKISRPGLWFLTVWLYLLPTAGSDVLSSLSFWVGLVYVCFPLNFMIYGWNDMVDVETDALNPRKDSWLWGARASATSLNALPVPMALVQLPFFLLFCARGELLGPLLIVGMVLANALYNKRQGGWRSRPPLELVNILAMLLLVPFSVWLNQTKPLSLAALIYLAVFCIQAHLVGEVMDMEPDRNAGRSTSALVMGRRATKKLIMALLAFEGALLWLAFDEHVLAVFLFLVLPWLIYDLTVLDRKPYSKNQFTLMGFGLNGSGYASILWLCYQGGLV